MKSKIIIVVCCMILLVLISVSACGKNDSKVDIPMSEELEIELAVPSQHEEKAANTEVSEDTENEPNEDSLLNDTKKELDLGNAQSISKSQENEGKQLASEIQKNNEHLETKENGEQQSALESQKDTEQTQTSQTPTATITGRIKSMGNSSSFSMSRATVSNDVMVSTDSDEVVSVVFSDSTEFLICATSDGGITSSYSSASSANLGIDKLVEVEGAYAGDAFVAKKVIIYSFG
jgi:hypothetical protein